MVTKEQVIEALKECYDPEIPVNVVDLGLIYDVSIEGEGIVHIKMTLTMPGCPMGAFIAQDVKNHVLQVKGVRDVEVELVFEPPWTPERMTEEAKKQLFG
jgi:FeS assembly SUF system protein